MEDNLHWKTTSYKEISRLHSAIYRRWGHFFGQVLFNYLYNNAGIGIKTGENDLVDFQAL